MTPDQIRNIGIIAHVDHGKTTLVDALLRQSGIFRANQAVAERAMDSMDLEREKGITIKSKNAAIHWNDVTINIVDTPGHADFGGEVERILKMVDGVLLLVDSVEGVQAQTRFVLRKAIENDLKLLVLVNKIDREFADPERVHDEILELLMELEASQEQFDAPFYYGSARDGYVSSDPKRREGTVEPLFDAILEHVPPPLADPEAPFLMLVSNLDWSDYVGRIGIGKIMGGKLAVGDSIVRIMPDGHRERARVSRISIFEGMGTAETDEAGAGQIVGLAGFENLHIGETLCDSEEREALPFVAIDQPTIRMQFAVNDGPFAGLDGDLLTARHIEERLIRETRINVSMALEPTDYGNVFTIKARGELQIAVLVETMRREGYEIMVSRPEVLLQEIDGKKMEPTEDIWLEVPKDSLGAVMELLAVRKGELVDMKHGESRVSLRAVIPTRGLIGLERILANLSSGEAIVSHAFCEYRPLAGEIQGRNNGALVSVAKGSTTAYALEAIQQRGRLFVGPGVEVYEGMVIGESARPGDLEVNPTRGKQLTNFRASGADKSIVLEPPENLSLEKAIEWINDDEYVEATPGHLRIRKRLLDAVQRKRANNGRKSSSVS